MSDPSASSAAIRVVAVDKRYRIWNSPSGRLYFSVWSQLHKALRLVFSRESGLLRRIARRRDALDSDYEALRNVSVTIARGESVGIIGRNGSGKSTLLQIIAATLRPTAGLVEVHGRVAAMLELASGFNPDFTGRENAELNAAILGLSRKEVDACLGAIIDFADLGLFIDQPVKTYSSGMVVRLGFAVLTQIEPEILIIDEALSVGDFLFQQKCFDFIRRFKERGGTLLFVSHSMATVLELCDRAIFLDSGRVAFDGPARDAVNLYEAGGLRTRFQTGERPLQVVLPEAVANEAAPSLDIGPDQASPEIGSLTSDDASLAFVRLFGADGVERDWITSEEEITLEIGLNCARALHDPHVGFHIRDRLGRVIFETSSLCMGLRIGRVAAGEQLVSRFRCALPLIYGEYSVTVGLANGAVGRDNYEEALLFQHGIKTFQIYRNERSIIWAGVCNLQPHATFTRHSPAPASAPNQVAS